MQSVIYIHYVSIRCTETHYMYLFCQLHYLSLYLYSVFFSKYDLRINVTKQRPILYIGIYMRCLYNVKCLHAKLQHSKQVMQLITVVEIECCATYIMKFETLVSLML